ncbi:MAG: hypothetical protein FJ190_05405 [Gammaproteobacteria bacterium]|nr:hypothetical protein [Gammaproteobacteria bacterium]
MTGMLASVNTLAEARLVLDAQVDIIDLKEPMAGSLGALPAALIKDIVEDINGRCPISCTIGDLPMDAGLIYTAVCDMVETGVDYVKIGLWSSAETPGVLAKLADLTECVSLIAVLFADERVDFDMIDQLYRSGFDGVMLDTLDKRKGALTEIMPLPELGSFVHQVKSRRLLCGLAGSLRMQDIPLLLPLMPDYLGFRGALCEDGDRLNPCSRRLAGQIRQAINTGA